MKTRIEVNETGEFFVVLPEEIVQDLNLCEGDIAEFYHEEHGLVELTFD